MERVTSFAVAEDLGSVALVLDDDLDGLVRGRGGRQRIEGGLAVLPL